jgi:hypothetical protein
VRNQCDKGTGSVACDIESRVRGAIEALHHLFVGWFAGELLAEIFGAGFSNCDLQCEGSSLRWFHIHETWLPEVVMSAGPHDF